MDRRARWILAMTVRDRPAAGGDASELADLLARLCALAVERVGVSGAAISLMAEGGLRSLAHATGPVSQQLDQLQFSLGEGPGVDAFDGGRPVLEPDLADGALARWPAYAVAAQERGARAVFAFPLHVGAISLGVLELFRDMPGSLSAEQMADAVAVADVAVTLILDGQAEMPFGALAGPLDHALHFPAEMYQATGMIMVQNQVSLTEAFVRLRAHAYAQGRSPAEVSRAVLAGELLLEKDPLQPEADV
ncbi:MAG: GAF and ANTAR domain-containing protein [Actinomycetes bacterium]